MSTPQSLAELEQAHAQAKARFDAASAAVAQNPKNEQWKEFSEAADALVVAERALSLARNQPTAVTIEWSAPWSIGASHPHVFANGQSTLLAYYVRQVNPEWDGKSVRVVDASTTRDPVAIVEFQHCTSTRFGTPSDDSLDGHPLFRHGLEAYCAHVVVNSEWIEALKRIHDAASGTPSETWPEKKHYLLSFKDTTFEVVADSYKIEIVDGPLATAFSDRISKLLAG